MKLRTLGPTLLCAAALCIPAALAGNAEQPQNMGHFYMARQQWTVIDETPQVTRTEVPAGTPGAAGAAGAAPGMRPGQLPRAGFTPYYTPSSGMGSSLPGTSNGVPTKPPPGVANGLHAKAGGLRPKSGSSAAKTAAKPASGPPVVKSYNPTGGYGGGSAAGTSSGNSSVSSSSTRQVRGSVMSWKKNRGF